jgi:hypothetical protein
MLKLINENRLKIEAIVLTDEEVKAAIFEAKKKKYFHEKNFPYWDEQEKKKWKKD